MRFGYVSNALRLDCRTNHRFRLRSYSEQRLVATVEANLACLERTLAFNREQGLLFFRISSNLLPFASHPVCTVDWRKRFSARLRELGERLRAYSMRVAMHPGQYVVLNAPDATVRKRSIAELRYHAALLDAMGVGQEAKIQIHVGGIYDSRERSIDRFCAHYKRLHHSLRSRLVIENDDRRFSLRDCLQIHHRVGIPVVLDTLHHQCLREGESIREALTAAFSTWKPADGAPMVDFSTQRPGGRRGTHAPALDVTEFRRFMEEAHGLEFDLMFEFRDKEASALRALSIAGQDRGKMGARSRSRKE